MTDLALDKATLVAAADYCDMRVIELGKKSDWLKANGTPIAIQEMYSVNYAWHELRVMAECIRRGAFSDGEHGDKGKTE